MWSWKGWGAVVLVAGLLSLPMYKYWNFLTQGMSPPKGTLMLADLETQGLGDFALPNLNGTQVHLSDFNEPVVLINVWATWCAPCIKEVPSLKRLAERFRGKIVILGISYDQIKDDILSFDRSFGPFPPNFVVLWDEKRSMENILGTDVLPETYILDRERKLVRKIVGDTVWDDPMAVEFFARLVE